MAKKGIQLEERNGSESKGYSKNSTAGELSTSSLITFLGRTPISWVKVIIYYFCYYSTLITFLGLNYYAFTKTMSTSSPTWIMEQGLIGSNPGLSIRPRTGADDDEQGDGLSILISYRVNNHAHAEIMAKQLDEAIKETQVSPKTPGVVDCSTPAGSKLTTSASTVCAVSLQNLGNCTMQNKYGYGNDTPCVLVKLNRIYGWIPEPLGLQEGKFLSFDFLQTELEQKEEMPHELKQFILNEVKNNKGNETQVLNKVWISCGEENTTTNGAPGIAKLPHSGVSYYPERAIPSNYFPFLSQPNYKSPFVMVQFQVPRISRHTTIEMECRAWAKNIHHEGNLINGLGTVKFGLLIN